METENPDSNSGLVHYLLELVLGRWNATWDVVPGGNSEGAAKRAYSAAEVQLLTLLEDQIRSMILHRAFVNPHQKYTLLEHGLLLLDGDFIIRGMAGGIASFLGRSAVQLYRTDFLALLTSESQATFCSVVTNAGSLKISGIDLYFKGADNAVLNACSFVSKILYGDEGFAVSVFGLQPVAIMPLSPIDNHQRIPTPVQQAYDFVLSHREGPLPTARQLARQFGTNEFELKRDFKKAFGTSIYHCYTLERLKRAKALLESTLLPLSDVAHACGFDDYSSFARAFRKHYKATPAKVRQSPT